MEPESQLARSFDPPPAFPESAGRMRAFCPFRNGQNARIRPADSGKAGGGSKERASCDSGSIPRACHADF